MAVQHVPLCQPYFFSDSKLILIFEDNDNECTSIHIHTHVQTDLKQSKIIIKYVYDARQNFTTYREEITQTTNIPTP